MITLDQGGASVAAHITSPTGRLGDVVEHGFVLDMHKVATQSWLVVPDASPHLLVHLGGGTEDPRWARASMVGARAVGVAFPVQGRRWTVGVRLRPGAIAALSAAIDCLPVDGSVSLVDVWGADGEALRRRLEGTPDRFEILRLALTFLAERTQRTVDRPWAVRAFERAVASGQGRGTVREAACAMGVAPRTLRRAWTRHTGITPMRRLRIDRLHRAADRLRAGVSGARVAQSAGYADQAHMSREFSALIGESPSRYRARGQADSFKPAG